jgi:hypothetical protein
MCWSTIQTAEYGLLSHVEETGAWFFPCQGTRRQGVLWTCCVMWCRCAVQGLVSCPFERQHVCRAYWPCFEHQGGCSLTWRCLFRQVYLRAMAVAQISSCALHLAVLTLLVAPCLMGWQAAQSVFWTGILPLAPRDLRVKQNAQGCWRGVDAGCLY